MSLRAVKIVALLAALATIAALVLGVFGGIDSAASRASPIAAPATVLVNGTNQAVVLENNVIGPLVDSNGIDNATTTITGTWRTVSGQASLAQAGAAVLLFMIIVSSAAAIATKSVGLDKLAGIVKWSAGQLGGAIGASLRTGASLALMAVALSAIALTAVLVGSAQTTFAGTGGYLGQDNSAGFPMWTLVALVLGSIVLVAGGIVTRRAGK